MMMMMIWSTLLLAVFCCHCCLGMSVETLIDSNGVTGTISFHQIGEEEEAEVMVTTSLEGLNSNDDIQWSITSFPFPPSSSSPCQLAGPDCINLGTLNLNQPVNYSNISISGSIMGRSLKISPINSSSICANILPDSLTLWAPFRSSSVANGNVFLWQQTMYISLTTGVNTANADMLTWAVLSFSCDEGVVCNHSNCATGNVTVEDNVVRAVVNGLELEDDVNGLSFAVWDPENVRMECVSITEYSPTTVVATSSLGGIVLTQQSPFHSTTVNLPEELGNLRYEVHTLPSEDDCQGSDGIFDPRGVGNSYSPPFSNDMFAFGDISGKAGNSSVYSDLYLPLSGENSIVGRPLLVISPDESVSGCGLLQYKNDIITLRAAVEMDGFKGVISFSSLADSSFADTVITIFINISTDITSSTSSLSSSSSLITASTPPPSSTILPSSTVSSFDIEPSSPPPSPITMVSSFILSSPSLPITSSSVTNSSHFSSPEALPSSSFSSSFLQLTPSSSFSSSISLSPTFTSLPLFFHISSVIPPSSSPLLGPYSTTDIIFSLPSTPTLSPSSTTLAVSTSPSPTPDMRKRRKREITQFNWSLRQLSSDSSTNDCSSLPIIGGPGNDDCSRMNPLSCPAGDLTAKHGPLSHGPLSLIFHDPYLPLNHISSAALYLEPANGLGDTTLCVPVTIVTSSVTPTSTTQLPPSSIRPSTSVVTSSPAPVTTPPTPEKRSDIIIIIGAVVGGVVGAVILLTVLMMCVCVCVRRRKSKRVDLRKQDQKKKNGRDVELGYYQPKPQIGSDQYRVVCSYTPHDTESDDLVLEKGEWVTLLEAPLGGQWWRGQTAGGREGWFPKSHVLYVDRDAERRKAEEENFKLAAAAIEAASNSFNERHLSLTKTKTSSTNSSGRRRAATAISKTDIQRTPTPPTLDRTPLDSVVIGNQRPPSSTTSASRPDTPYSTTTSEPLTNLSNHVSTENSQTSSGGNSDLSLMNLEPYLAKYTFTGGTSIELPMKKGDIVSVLEKREGGWWQGVCRGKVGWFPSTYVKQAPVRKKDEEEEEKKNIEKDVTTKERQGLPQMEESLKSDTVDATEYRAIHTYTSETEGDLQFSEGDKVLVYWVHENGWWYGSKDDGHGWFPYTYVELNTSEVGSPLPVTPGVEEEERGGEEVETVVKEIVKDSSLRRSWKKRLSFKKSRSQDGLDEGGLTPLIPKEEVKGEIKRTQSRPRRRAPPPPGKTLPNTTSEQLPSQTTPTDATSAKNSVAKKHNRPKRAATLDSAKPRRLPPAPPASLTTPKATPTDSAHPPNTAESAESALATPSAEATPIAPLRRKKMQKVKRPATRLIPPPPTIPLPLPPPSPAPSPSLPPRPQTPVSTTAEPAQLMKTDVLQKTMSDGERGGGGGGGGGGEVESNSALRDSGQAEEKVPQVKTETVIDRDSTKSPTIRSKPPPTKPKPAHLSRKFSDIEMSAIISPSPQGSPKPPPPARTSSLHHPVPHPRPRRKPKSALTSIPDDTSTAKEEVDSEDKGPDSEETAEAARNLRSAPPSHPPPPRPSTAGPQSPKQRSDPPSFPPPQRPSNETSVTPSNEGEKDSSLSRTGSLKSRGSHLMRSLKKMVQRSESKEDGFEPTSPARGQRSPEVIENKETETPVLERKRSVGLPARPPPPRLVKQSSEEKKSTPTRPPPPKLSSTSSISENKSSHTLSHAPSLPIQSTGTSPVHSTGSRSVSPLPPSSFYRAMIDYDGGGERDELSFKRGDVLVELDRPSNDMFYGMLDDGTTGLFPSSAVESISTPSPSSNNK